jgi:hypothetical protein
MFDKAKPAAYAVICLCAAGSASAQSLTVPEQTLVTASIGITKVESNCPNVEHVPGALVRFGDVSGIDTDRLLDAVVQAMMISLGKNYDHSKLIPEVTRLLNSTADAMNEDIAKDKSSFCNVWTRFYTEHDFIRPKQPKQ